MYDFMDDHKFLQITDFVDLEINNKKNILFIKLVRAFLNRDILRDSGTDFFMIRDNQFPSRLNPTSTDPKYGTWDLSITSSFLVAHLNMLLFI